MYFQAKPAPQFQKEEKQYLAALKVVTERNLAPEISSYCLRKFKGETPFNGPEADPHMGVLMTTLLKSIAAHGMLAPPFTTSPKLTIAILETMSCNINVKPNDFRKLIEGCWVPAYVVRNTRHIFEQYRGEWSIALEA